MHPVRFAVAALALGLVTPSATRAQSRLPEEAPVAREGRLGLEGRLRRDLLGERVDPGVEVEEAAPAPRLVFDADWEPDRGRSWFMTLVRGSVDEADNTFFDLPFPLDLRLRENGAPDLSALPIPRLTTFFRLPRQKLFIRRAFRLVEEDTRGFSPSGPIYFRFDGPINPPAPDPAAAVDPASPLVLVDIDPRSPERLRRHPLHARVTESADSFRPEHLLQLLPVPGLPLRPNTRYAALVLRDLGAPGAPRLHRAPALAAILAGEAPPGRRGADLLAAYAPLRAVLPELGIAPEEVAAATVFTTGDPAARLLRQAEHIARRPPPPMEDLEVRDTFPDFTALRGTVYLPQYQRGRPPYVINAFWGGGEQALDARGLPMTRRTDAAEFQLSVPTGEMPSTGFPLYFYCHGTGGTPDQAIDRGIRASADEPAPLGSGHAELAARRGWGTACVATSFSTSRLGVLAADGYAAYNLLNPVAMRDNYLQMVLELVHFRNLVLNLRVDPALCPGTDASAAPDGKVFFDPDRVVIAGQSLGSFLAAMLAATTDGARGVLLSGAGASWIEFPFGPKVPVDLALLLANAGLPDGELLDRFHPLVMVFNTAMGPADNVHYLRYLQQVHRPGRSVVPHLLVIEGQEDLQVPTNAQRALILAAQADLAGPDVGATPAEQVRPALTWGGLRQLPLPAGGNRMVPGHGPRTALVLRYAADDVLRDGHHVAFQLPEARAQVGAFLDAIAAGEVPMVR